MGLRINQNIMAMNANRNLTRTQSELGKSLEKLSSGFRINRAADDAAGLVISENLRSQIGGTQMAVRNAQDAISVVQTAEGALGEVHSMLQRIRDLAVQSANSGGNGGNSGAAVAAAQAEVDELINAIDQIATTTKFSGTSLLDNAATLTFQVGANSGEIINIGLDDMRSSAIGGASFQLANIKSGGGNDFVTAAGNAAAALSIIDQAIGDVSTTRGKLGATQNRLEHQISSLQVANENLSASESRIRDADMAMEMTAFTRSQILSQAGTAMLAQANQVPQGVLSLLQG